MTAVSGRQVRRLSLLWTVAAGCLLAYALLVDTVAGVSSSVVAALALLLGTGANAARAWHAGERTPAVGWLVMGLGWALLAAGVVAAPVGWALAILGGGALLAATLGRTGREVETETKTDEGEP